MNSKLLLAIICLSIFANVFAANNLDDYIPEYVFTTLDKTVRPDAKIKDV